MKLITEVACGVLTEATANKDYYIKGVFLQANLKNRNGRVYPKAILSKEVERYNREYVQQNRALGELGHPDGPTINMDRASHLIKELFPDGNNYIGKAKVMDTPMGKIVKVLIDEGVKLGVSSRGMGSLREVGDGVQEVQDDFYLATAADIVADPSAPAAFVQGIMEGKEWVWNNGILTENVLHTIRTKLDQKGGKKNVIEAFETLLNGVGRESSARKLNSFKMLLDEASKKVRF